MPVLINNRAQKIAQFQKITGEDIVTAIAYLEAEEFVVEEAVISYRGDKAYAEAHKNEG